jgi:hypothetical protein
MTRDSFSLQVDPKLRSLEVEEDRFPLPYIGVLAL